MRGQHFAFRLMGIMIGLGALAGCDAPQLSINGHSGVPLAQLSLAGRTVHEITLLGPDTVNVVHGATLDIQVTGDPQAVAALRFVLSEGKLGIGRASNAEMGSGIATVTVTDPAVDHLVMAGSGAMTADQLTGESVGITIGGSGRITAARIAAKQLAVDVLGSGTFTGSGTADTLAMTLAGSGKVDMAQLKAGDTAIDVAGSGSGTVASDGRVTGSVVGSGVFTVRGKAHCDVSVTGSGSITCQP
jgi:hypothetical protein